MPPFIAYGVGNGLHLPLACGMEVILIPSFDPSKFDKLLVKYKPNHMVGVPSHYGSLMESRRLKKMDLSFIIAPTVGGDKMDEELEKKVNEFLEQRNCPYKIVKGYGLTEVNAAVAACTSNLSNEIGSVGIPFPKTNISIFEPGTEHELSYGEIGEVYITGPNTMLEYYDNPVETDNVVKVHSDGTKWVHSGDLGMITPNGNLYIIDRIKRLIIRHDGFKIFPTMIEDIIKQDPNVEHCKVVGVRDYDFSQGYQPYAHIILKNKECDLDQEKIRIMNLCRLKLPEYCQLFDIQFDDAFPLTPIGKVDFRKMEIDDDIKVKKLRR
jgi:long-chain acyl-CoA synthetase